MTIDLIIDNRERDLINIIPREHKFKTSNLDIGDVIFKYHDSEEPILVLERKTIADLKASICDGRHREQKARLLGSIDSNRIMYIIEGSLDKNLSENIQGMSYSTLISSLINTQLRDNIKVYKTSSIKETCNFILKLHDKLIKDIDMFFQTNKQTISNEKYCSTLKKSKKANMTPKVWFISQLSLIPQISEKIASVITDKYPSVILLVEAYNDTEESMRPKLLSDITYPIKGDKTRRVGDKISSKVFNFFYDI